MTDDARYWLLAGATPTGPVTLADLHARLADGRVSGETKVCRVGDAAWVPLFAIPGVGPPAVPGEARAPSEPLPMLVSPGSDDSSALAASEPVPPPRPVARPVARPIARPVDLTPEPPVTEFIHEPAVSTPPAAPPTPTTAAEYLVIVVGICVLVAILYGFYSWLTPLSPRDVAQRFADAKTAAEAKDYAVPSFHRAVDEIYLDPNASNPADHIELTHDAPFTNGHFVGFRGQTYLPEMGRRANVDGVIVLTKHGGWKVFDIVFFTFDGQRIDPPASIGAAITGADRPPTPLDAAKDWYNNPANRKGAILAGGFLGVKLLPKLLLGLGVIAAAGWAVIKGIAKASSKRNVGGG